MLALTIRIARGFETLIAPGVPKLVCVLIESTGAAKHTILERKWKKVEHATDYRAVKRSAVHRVLNRPRNRRGDVTAILFFFHAKETAMRKSYNVVFGLMVAGLLGSHTATAQNQRSQDQVRPNSARMQNNQGAVTVEQAIAKKLMMANKAEIELAELAQQKSKNQQVTQFADQLASDHEQVLQKLKHWETQKEGQVDRERSGRSGNQTPRQQTGDQTEDQPNQDTGSANPQRDRLLGQGQNQDREQQRGNRGMRSTVPQALCAIMEKASTNCQQMTKQMLQNYEGADFDMAFVGQQTIAHMTLLAELRAIEEQGLGQLSQIAGKAATTTESHLEKLKQLARELENNSTRG